MNSESQHTESVKKILCADSYAKKGNGKKAKKGIREKDYSKARNYDTLFASWTKGIQHSSFVTLSTHCAILPKYSFLYYSHRPKSVNGL